MLRHPDREETWSLIDIPVLKMALIWVAVKEFDLSYYIGETLSLTIYIYISILVNQSKFLNSNPVMKNGFVSSCLIDLHQP